MNTDIDIDSKSLTIEELLDTLNQGLKTTMPKSELENLSFIDLSNMINGAITEHELTVIINIVRLTNITHIIVGNGVGFLKNERTKIVNMMDSLLKSTSLNIEFEEDSEGTCLLLNLESVVNGCNKTHLFNGRLGLSFTEFLNGYIDPQKFIDELDGWRPDFGNMIEAFTDNVEYIHIKALYFLNDENLIWKGNKKIKRPNYNGMLDNTLYDIYAKHKEYEIYEYPGECATDVFWTPKETLEWLNRCKKTEISMEEFESLSVIDLSDNIKGNIDVYNVIAITHILKFSNIKTIIVNSSVGFTPPDEPDEDGCMPDIINSFLNSGLCSIQFRDEKNGKDEKVGGYFEFQLECGVDDSSEMMVFTNTYPLCESFRDLLDIYLNPQQFIDNLDGEDVFGLFKKIEDDIFEMLGAGDDQFINIKGLFFNDQDYLIWEYEEA